jgi:hypothetical protein
VSVDYNKCSVADELLAAVQAFFEKHLKLRADANAKTSAQAK